MEASYCLCGQPYNPNIFMIQCDGCRDWFHGSCCNFQEHTAVEIDKYHCPRCAPLLGPSLYKPYKNFHRHDYWDESAIDKPVQTGTDVFIRELRARHFNSEGEAVIHMRGQQLTETVLAQRGFDMPIIIDSRDGLDMTIPPENFSLYDVESYVGGDYEMDVIDVTRQMDIKMRLRDFVAYFNSLNRTRVFNVVSLEFSNTGLSRMVEAPLIARKMDWVNAVWPRDYPVQKPQVQKYCLMSVKDSYTDFHIDFGGTSVWYHVLRGEKIFYFIRPSPANLTLYQHWMTSSNQSETFFGDQVDRCYKCTLQQGQTMLVPTGWIHAVLTPVDSLVFGGNFLHSLNIPMQLQVYDIEKKVKTAAKFLYPHFEMINWFAAQKLLDEISTLNIEEQRCPANLISGLKCLVSYLKQWNTDKDYSTYSREQVPIGLNVTKFFKDVSREVRHAERYINTLNPPKPERESKRKRKKPVNKDFVDYSTSKSSLEFMTVDNFSIAKSESPKTSSIKLTLPKPVTYPYNLHPLVGQSEVINTYKDPGERPAETTAVHRGGTVLKIKLGTKDKIPVLDHSQVRAGSIDLLSQSIYDFHDDSEREEDCFNLTIDETSKRRKNEQAGLKLKLHDTSLFLHGKLKEQDVDVESEQPKNGIESLLKASALALPGEGSGRTSPSTQEAIAGMLSIAQTYLPSRKSTKSHRYRAAEHSDDDDTLNNVHQDEDYIYPALDNSDDDDVHIFKPRGRSKIDEPWNPKARVGPLLPKMNRPAREGTKKQAVEKVLEAAAKRASTESTEKSPKRQYRRKKVKPKVVEKVQSSPSTSSGTVPTASVQIATPTTPKPRKGMKTAKQRLGKILKIHKMMH